MIRAAILAAVLVLAAGPADAGVRDTPCPASNPPNELTLVGGTPQTARIGTPFAEPFRVALANANGCPLTTAVAGTVVTFAAPGSGPSGIFSTSGSAVAVVGADATGGATAPAFTANDTAGSYAVVAVSRYGSVSFALTNTAAGVPASIVPLAPTAQSAVVGAHFASPLRAQVLDANGNPVQGAQVAFGLGPGATFDGGDGQASAVAGSSGVATSPGFTAGEVPGPFTATASTPGIAQPAAFALDALTGPAPAIARIGPRARSATVGAEYARALQVKVTAAGAPLQGAAVTFALGGGGAGGAGASFLAGAPQATATTNGAGVATSPRFQANAAAGRFTASATLAGGNAAALFSLDNLAAAPPSVRPVGSARRAARVDTRFRRPLEVRVLNGSRRPVAGATVTFALGGGGGTGGTGGASAGPAASFTAGGAEATATTNARGIAVSPRFEANATAGRLTATATLGGRLALFTLRNLPGRAATLTAGAAATESTVAGTRFPIRLAVTVADREGNPVEGASVRFTAPADGPSGTFAGRHGPVRAVRVRTNAAGIAVAPSFTANREQGGYAVTAAVRHAGRAAFGLANLP